MNGYELRADAREANCTKCRELKICRTVDEEFLIHRLCAECFREFSDEHDKPQTAGGGL